MGRGSKWLPEASAQKLQGKQNGAVRNTHFETALNNSPRAQFLCFSVRWKRACQRLVLFSTCLISICRVYHSILVRSTLSILPASGFKRQPCDTYRLCACQIGQRRVCYTASPGKFGVSRKSNAFPFGKVTV